MRGPTARATFANSLMPLGFLHDGRWFDSSTFSGGSAKTWSLEPQVAEFEHETGVCQFEMLQVKEKFGKLRLHVNDASDAIRECIEVAKQESLRTCEVCGQAGKRREDGWIKTLCNEYAGTQ